jgi:hypothetical protein
VEEGEKLAEELRALFDLQSDLPKACSEAESYIVGGIPIVIEEAVGENPRSDDKSRPSIVCGGIAFHVRAREMAGDDGTIVVAIGEAGTHWRTTMFVRESVELYGGGRYTKVNIEVDERLGAKLDRIASALHEYLQGGYRRMETHVVAELLAVEHRVAIDLYAEVRGAFEEEIALHIGLYFLLPDGRAMYQLDPLAIQTVLSRLEAKRPTASASPLALAAILVKGWVKTEDTVAEHALSASQPLGFRLQELAYTTTPGFDIAEDGIYQGSYLICQPIVRDAPIRLIAAYPVGLREIVEADLDRMAPRFGEILLRHERATKRMLMGGPGTTRWNAGRFAELLGRFIGGFAESLH